MTKFTSTNVQYYLVVGLLQDATSISLDRCLERDMLAMVAGVPSNRWGITDDVHHLSGLLIRLFEKAGISVVASLGEESDYNPNVDQEQVIKDLFALHRDAKDFLSVTWHTDKVQREVLDELVGKTLAAAEHSRTVLRSIHHKQALIAVSA
jgi:hypothetical protein